MITQMPNRMFSQLTGALLSPAAVGAAGIRRWSIFPSFPRSVNFTDFYVIIY